MEDGTKIYKDIRDGWQGETYRRVDGMRFLKLSTYNGRPGLVSHACCVVDQGDGAYKWEPFGDWQKRVIVNPVRCTEKFVREQHAAAEAQIDALIVEARAFYVAKAGPAPKVDEPEETEPEEEAIRALESEGMNRSDAQGVYDAEELKRLADLERPLFGLQEQVRSIPAASGLQLDMIGAVGMDQVRKPGTHGGGSLF